MSTNEAVAATGKSRDALYHMARRGKLRARRKGKYWLFHPDDIAALSADEAASWSGQPYQPKNLP